MRCGAYQEGPRWCERLEIMGRVEPYHEHGEADEAREDHIHPSKR